MATITKTQAAKILKTAAYVAVSAVLGYFASVVADTPELFGIFAPVINVVLVFFMQLIKDSNK